MPAQVTVTGPDGVSETIRSFAYPADVVKAAGVCLRQGVPDREQFSDKAALDDFFLPIHRANFTKLQESGFTLQGSYNDLQSEMGEDGYYWLDPYCLIGIRSAEHWAMSVDRVRILWRAAA